MAGRGANGRSTIVKQDDGRWHGFVSMGAKGDGSRDRRHVSAATRAAVVEKVKALETKRDAGMVGTAGKAMLVEDWLDYWAENIASVRVRARTLATYRTMIRLHLTPYIGKRRLDQLQPEHLEQTYKQLVDKGLSPASVLRVHRMLHRALKIAMQRDRVARNVATLVEPPRQERPKTPEPLDVEECKRVLVAAEGLRNSARWTVALALGLRQSEALALQWKDIDFDRGTLSVRRGLHRVPGEGLVFTEPKTDRSRRTIAVPAPLIEALRKQKVAQNEERLVAGTEWDDWDLVFAQPNGRPLDKHSDYEAWIRLLNRAKVRHIRLHDGRHTAATLLLTAGVHPRVVMELLGHSQMRTTTDIYSHVMPALAQEAADRMAKTLWTNPNQYPSLCPLM
jgi:integrase